MSDDVVVGESRTSPWACLAACTICAIIALIAATFDWTLIDCFRALIFLPGHLIAAIAPLAVCAIWALFEARRWDPARFYGSERTAAPSRIIFQELVLRGAMIDNGLLSVEPFVHR
jgi:hypothetical protein